MTFKVFFIGIVCVLTSQSQALEVKSQNGIKLIDLQLDTGSRNASKELFLVTLPFENVKSNYFYLISEVYPSLQPSSSCQGELHLIRYDYSTNTIVPVMTITQSSVSNNRRIITRITPNFNAYFNRYFISTYGNCCWRLYKRYLNWFLFNV